MLFSFHIYVTSGLLVTEQCPPSIPMNLGTLDWASQDVLRSVHGVDKVCLPDTKRNGLGFTDTVVLNLI